MNLKESENWAQSNGFELDWYNRYDDGDVFISAGRLCRMQETRGGGLTIRGYSNIHIYKGIRYVYEYLRWWKDYLLQKWQQKNRKG